MARGISIGGTSLPVTDATAQVQRNPISEKSLSYAGEPVIYGGTYGCSGSFSGVYRPDVFKAYLDDILADTPATYDIIISDEFASAQKYTTCKLTSAEVSIKVSDFAKCTFNWVGQMFATSVGVSVSAASYDTGNTPVFYNTMVGSYKVTEFTTRINRPLAADDFVIGSEYTQTIVQSDNRTIEGTITLASRDYDLFLSGLLGDSSTDPSSTNKNAIQIVDTLTVTFRHPSTGASNIGSMTFGTVVLSSVDYSMSGRQKVQKSLSFKAVGLTVSNT